MALFVFPFVVRHYRGKPFEFESEWDKYIPIEEVLARHDKRIDDRIKLLKKQTLEESFVELLEDQQYFYPGFQTEVVGVPRDIQKILSTRTFLKVFQQFDALPREQAIKKLNELSKEAIRNIEDVSADIADKEDRRAVNYLLCTTMLLAAHVGEPKLLLNFMDDMRHSFDAAIQKVKVARPDIEWSDRNSTRYFGPLEDEIFLTVLMYALKQANMEIPIDESTFIRKTIPLCRWDAPLTYYDFSVWHGDAEIDPKDVVKQFVVYEFPNDISHFAIVHPSVYEGDYFDSHRKKLFINALKDALSK